eukprot:4051060-Pleurochrysis_carterae.AAC.1
MLAGVLAAFWLFISADFLRAFWREKQTQMTPKALRRRAEGGRGARAPRSARAGNHKRACAFTLVLAHRREHMHGHVSILADAQTRTQTNLRRCSQRFRTGR